MMIHLEHINLIVKDMADTLKFYQTVFPHWFVRGSGHGDWYGYPRNWLHFGDDYQYLTFNDNGTGVNRNLKGHEMGMAHFGLVSSDVKGIMQRLKAAGYQENVAYSEQNHRASVYFLDPNGYEIEFVQYFSDMPELRNMYEVTAT